MSLALVLLSLSSIHHVKAVVESSTFPTRYILLDDFTETVTIQAQSRIDCVAMGLKYEPRKNLIQFEEAPDVNSAPTCTLGKADEMAVVPGSVDLSGNDNYTRGVADIVTPTKGIREITGNFLFYL